MTVVQVRTRVEILAPPEAVWPFLCQARMPLPPPWWFRFGVPIPQSCRLVDGVGGVGKRRQCQTDRGAIEQRITEWEPGARLAFVAVADTVGLARRFDEMTDRFVLESWPGGTRVTRNTRLALAGRGAFFPALLLRALVPQIHRYVLYGIKDLAEKPHKIG